MPGSVQELTGTLLSAIDQEGNVKDMTIVLNVVKDLERTNVTAEDLKVTRLGKFVNLIRRRVADVDKPLSKRLKNLVKQWQQLVPVPNGVVPPAPPPSSSSPRATPTANMNPPSASSLLPLNSARANNDGHTSLSIRTTPSPSDPCGLPTSNSTGGVSYSPQPKTTSPPKPTTSFLALSNITTSSSTANSRPNSRGPPSRSCTPTPPANIHTSRPVQLVSATPASNRSRMMQKLSSVKKSPGKAQSTQQDDIPVRPEIQAESLPSISSYLAGSGNESEGVANMTGNMSFITDEEMSNWTSDSFMDMAIDDFTVGEGPWAQIASNGNLSVKDTSACNGARGVDPMPDFNKNSRKRPRPHSPFQSEQAAHKKHKPHKSSSKKMKIETQETEKLIVRIPLDRVFVNHHHLLVHKDVTERNRSSLVGANKRASSKPRKSASPVVELELIVSIRRCLLSRIPTAKSIGLRCHTPNRTKNRRKSHDRGRKSHDQHNQTSEQDYSLPDLPAIPDMSEPTKPVTFITESTTTKDSTNTPVLHIPISRQRPAPQGVCPGVDGCVGPDGYWYEWTEHISNCGEQVTVMPYIYFEDDYS